MTTGEMALRGFRERIEEKYLRWLRKGCHDVAVVIDTTDQEYVRQGVARQRGEPESTVDAFGGLVVAGDRLAVADQLNKRLPGNEAVKCLREETPPEGDFPVLLLMAEEPRRTCIHFFYIPRPEPTADWATI